MAEIKVTTNTEYSFIFNNSLTGFIDRNKDLFIYGTEGAVYVEKKDVPEFIESLNNLYQQSLKQQ